MTYKNDKAEIEEITKNVLDETGKQGTERFMSFTMSLSSILLYEYPIITISGYMQIGIIKGNNLNNEEL